MVMIGVSIAWVPVVTQTQGGQVFIYIQEVTNYLAPQVACVFILGLLWRGCNEQVNWSISERVQNDGVMSTLQAGSLLGNMIS